MDCWRQPEYPEENLKENQISYFYCVILQADACVTNVAKITKQQQEIQPAVVHYNDFMSDSFKYME